MTCQTQLGCSENNKRTLCSIVLNRQSWGGLKLTGRSFSFLNTFVPCGSLYSSIICNLKNTIWQANITTQLLNLQGNYHIAGNFHEAQNFLQSNTNSQKFIPTKSCSQTRSANHRIEYDLLANWLAMTLH